MEISIDMDTTTGVSRLISRREEDFLFNAEPISCLEFAYLFTKKHRGFFPGG
jgi:hypothetical protein